MDDNRRKLYDALSQDYDMGSFEQFTQDIQDEGKRQKLYDAIKEEYELPDFGGFSAQLGISNAPQPVVQQPIAPQPKPVEEPTQVIRQPTAPIKPSYDEEFVMTESQLDGKRPKLPSGIPSVMDMMDEKKANQFQPKPIGNTSQQETKTPQQPKQEAKKPSKLSAEDKKALDQSMRKTLYGVAQSSRDAETKSKYIQAQSQKPFESGAQKIELGLGKKTDNVFERRNPRVIEDTKYNPETGKYETTYINEAGEYKNKAVAEGVQDYKDWERQNEMIPLEFRDIPLDTELEAAYAERDRLNQLAKERREELEKEESSKAWYLRALEGANADKVGSNENRRIDTDEKYQQYMAALRKNNELITSLEDAQNGDTNGFWHTLGTEIANGYTFSVGGLSRLNDVNALLNAQKHIDSINRKRKSGEKLTKEEEAAEAVLKNAAWDNKVQGKYGDIYGAWARAGKMGATSLDFMFDFMLMGGMPAKTAKSIAGGVVRGGEKLLGKYGSKGFGNYMLRATGATLGSMVAGAEITNTIQAPKTVAEIGQKIMGNATIDKGGNYVYEDGMGALKAAFTTERDFIGENASEVLGEFMGGKAAIKGLQSIGLTKIANGLTALSGKNWYKGYTQALKTAGFHGVAGESLEEYANFGFDFIMGGDQWKSIKDPRTHIDIILGCATMGAFLNAPRVAGTAYGAAQYLRYKHNTDVASSRAAAVFGSEEWAELQDILDNSDNTKITNALMSILFDEEFKDDQRAAAFNYVRNLQAMRGYSLGYIDSNREEGETNESKIGNSYIEGYNLTQPQDMADAKFAYDYERSRISDIVTDEMMQQLDEDPVGTLDRIMNDDAWTDQEKQAALDYVNSKATFDGMTQKVQDNIETQTAGIQAELESVGYKEKKDATPTQIIEVGIIKGTPKETEPRRGYVISGDYMNDEGNILVMDAETGKITMMQGMDVIVNSVSSIEETRKQRENEIAQQAVQEASAKINGTLPFNAGDQYTIVDGEGNQHQVTIGISVGLEEGQVLASVDGAEAQPMNMQEIQQMHDNYNRARLADYEANKAAQQEQKQAEQEQAPAPQVPQAEKVYETGDELTLYVDGNPVGGFVQRVNDSEGQYVVMSDEPINGNTVNYFTKEELDNLTTMPEASVEPVVEEMPMTEEGKPDYMAATPERSAQYIYGERNLTEEEADAFVENNRAAAEAEQEKLQADKPKMETDIDEYEAKKAEWQAKVDEAKARADYWKAVQDTRTRQRINNSIAEEQARQEGVAAEEASPEQTGANEPAATPLPTTRRSQKTTTSYQRRLNKAKTSEEKAQVVAEYLAEISGNSPVKVLTNATLIEGLREAGANDEIIAYAQEQIARGNSINGFYTNGTIYINADAMSRIDDIRSKFVHERQHGITENPKNSVYLQSVADSATEEELAGCVRIMSGSNAYDNQSKETLADEFISFAMEVAYSTPNDEALEQILASYGANERLIEIIKGINNEQRQDEHLSDARRNVPLNRGESIGNRQDERDSAAQSAGGLEQQGTGTPAPSIGRAEEVAESSTEEGNAAPEEGAAESPVSESEAKEQEKIEAAAPVPAKIEGVNQTNFSISALGDSFGLDAYESVDGKKIPHTDAEGNVVFRLGDKEFSVKNKVSGNDLKDTHSAWNMLLNDAISLGTINTAKADRILDKLADMVNMVLEYGSAANGGIKNLTDKWQWIGEEVWKTVETNGDPQYGTSIDITRVCKKNEQMIYAISELQNRQGYGVTPAQILDLYEKIEASGFQTPCPVCYVFSRYIRNGKYAGAAINGMVKYGEHLPNGSEPWTLEQWKNEYLRLEAIANSKEYKDAAKKANADLDNIPDVMDDLRRRIMSDKVSDNEKEAIRKQIDMLDERYRKALDLYSQFNLTNWIKSYALNVGAEPKNKNKQREFSLRDDIAMKPEDMADYMEHCLDLRLTASVYRNYPAIQRLRKSGGSAAGKEITFAADNYVGEVALGIGRKAGKDLKNKYKIAADENADPADRKKARREASAELKKSVLIAARQTLRGGQRMWSWSDNIERLAPDVIQNLIQMELVGGAVQSYSKQLEGINMVAKMKAYVNGSLMGRGLGYEEVDEKDTVIRDGKRYLANDIKGEARKQGKTEERLFANAGSPIYEKDGKYYVATFDDVVGVDPFSHDDETGHKKGLFELNQELDKAGNIIVGMNDTHVRVALADDRIFFCIPWHSSGQSVHILQQMMNILGVPFDGKKATDYTAMQEEKSLDGSNDVNKDEKGWKNSVVTKDMIDLWEDVRKNELNTFACGIEGGIESGTEGSLSEGQKHYRELRSAIVDGTIYNNKEWLKEVEADAFLGQMLDTIKATVPADSKGVVRLDNGDNNYMYPYEYWDTNSTYDTADINGLRYLEYCRRLGRRPKFSGKWTDGVRNAEEGNFINDKGYWKLLIDRRMYGVDKAYQGLDPVDSDGVEAKDADPKWTNENFIVTRVADNEKTSEIVDDVRELEKGRFGDNPAVDYDNTTPEEAAKSYLNEANNTDAQYKEVQESLKKQPSFSITAEREQAYDKAVAEGDMETAQRMVIDAAKKAMPNTKVVDENGNPLVVYHGSPRSFNEFRSGFFTDNRDVAESYFDEGYDENGKLYEVYLSIKNPIVIENPQAWNLIQLTKEEAAKYGITESSKVFDDEASQEAIREHNERTGQEWILTTVDDIVDAMKKSDKYDGVIIKGLWGDMSDGGLTDKPHNEYIPKNATQIKSAEIATYDDNGNLIPLSKRFSNSNDIRFSIEGEKADVEKTLMGVHNISEDKLKKAIKLGGLANPSMAVIDTKNGMHNEFGNISLIPKSTLIDSRTGRNAGTYAGDAYTPSYPRVENLITKQGEWHIHEIAKSIAGGDRYAYYHLMHKLEDYIKDNREDRLQFIFLAQTGRNPELKGERTLHTHEEYEDIKKIFNIDLDQEYPSSKLTEEQNEALMNLMIDKYVEDSKQYLSSLPKGIDKEEFIKDEIEDYKKNIADKYGKLYLSAWDNYVNGVIKDERIRKRKTIDWDATERDADDRISREGLREEYENWKRDLLDSGDVEEKIFVGYTPSGKRKYVPNTLKDVSRLMNKESNTNSYNEKNLNATRSSLLEKMRTLSDIRKNRELLQGKEVYRETQDEMSDEYVDIVSQISSMDRVSDNPFINLDIAAERLQDAITKRDPIAHLNKEYGYEIAEDGEFASQLTNFIDDVKRLPVKYFETKFKRPVMLNEFAVAVVPEGTSTEVMDALKNAGLDVRTYDGTEEGREKVTMDAVNSRNDIMFSFAGERGAAEADRAEGVVTRIDGLATAKQMEADGKPALNIKMATGWERGKDGKWRYEMPDLKLKQKPEDILQGTKQLIDMADAPELFAAYPSLKKVWVEVYDDPLSSKRGDTSVRRIKDTEAYEMATKRLKEYPTYESYIDYLRQTRDKLVKKARERGDEEEADNIVLDYSQAESNSRKNYDSWLDVSSRPNDIYWVDISLNRGASSLSEDYGMEKTLIHEVQHVIQEIEGFARGGNSRSVINDEEVRNVFINELQNAQRDAAELLERAKKSGDEENITLAQGIVNRWNAVAKDFMDGDIDSKKAFEYYQRLAGEVEARNASERANMTAAQRRRSLAEETEDIPRGEQIVTYGDVGESASIVRDYLDIARLEAEPKEVGYRNVVLNEDGTLGSPMASKLGKKGADRKATSGFEFGKWERSDENPDLADENGKINLIKPDGKPVEGVDYNPYIHIRPTLVNKQFKQAWERPNLVYVRTQYPVSELTDGYKAEKAKLSVGKHPWGGGELILSRWDKPIEIVPWEEVADDWVKEFDGKGIHFDIIPPKLLPILAERGMEILPPHKGMGNACNEAYNEWLDSQQKLSSIGDVLNEKGISIDDKNLLDEYGLSHVTLTKKGDVVTLTHFIAKDKGQGNGTRFMEDLIEEADKNGWTLALTPDDSFGATSVGRLKNFYKRFGFKDNKGRSTDFTISESMVRKPKELQGLSEGGIWENAEGGGLMMHSIDVTPEMKESVMQGQPMFNITEAEPASTEEITSHIDNIRKEYGVKGGAIHQVITDRSQLEVLNRIVPDKAYRLIENDFNDPEVAGVHIPELNMVALFAGKMQSRLDGEKGWLHEQAHRFWHTLPEDIRERFSTACWNKLNEDYPELVEWMQERYNEDSLPNEACSYYTETILDKIGLRGFFANTFTGNEELCNFANGLRDYLRYGKEKGTDNQFGRSGQGSENAEVPVFGNTEGRNEQLEGEAEEGLATDTPRFSISDKVDRAIVRDRYERHIKSGTYQFREAMQDSMLSLRRMMEDILKAEGKPVSIEDIPANENPYLAENAMSSKSHAEQELYGKLLFNPLLNEVKRLKDDGASRDEITTYMMAKHGIERNIVMAQRAYDKYKNENPDGELTLDDFRVDYAGLTGLTEQEDVLQAEADAQAIVDAFESAHETAELWERTNACTEATLRKQYEGGLLSKEAYESIRDMYDFYIPLRGFDETTSDEVYAYLNHDAPAYSGAVKTAKGRKSVADDPLATIANMADAGIMQANRNMMKQEFLNFVLRHPSDLASVNEIWLRYDDVNGEWVVATADINENDSPEEVQRKTEEFEERMKQLAQAEPNKYKRSRDAKNIPFRTINGTLKEHQVMVKAGGKSYIITINGNPRVAQAMNGLTNPDTEVNGAVGKILKAGEFVTRQMSAFYTTRNPEFVLSNFIRDLVYSNSTMWVRESPAYAAKFNKNFVRVNPKIIYSLIQKHNSGTLDMNNEIERAFYDFMMNGGETGYTSVQDIEKQKKLIKKYIKDGNKVIANAQTAWEIVGAKLDEINRSVENCARFAAFITSRQMGRSIERSVYDAKEVSVNFNKKGAGSKFLDANGQTALGNTGAFISGLGRSGWVFWNASIQGVTNFGRLHKRHTAKAIAYDTALFTLGALIAGYGGGDDDDYWKLPEYVRRNNICIKIPATHSFIKIPIGQELRAIYGMGELAASVLSGNERKDSGELNMAIISQLSQTMPLDLVEGGHFVIDDEGTHFGTLAPSWIKPVVENVENRNWMDMPIYDDSEWNKEKPEWQKANKRTNKWLINFSKWTNDITGGDDVKRGWLNWNPSKLEHLIEGVFGGYSTTANKLVKMYETVEGEQPFDWSNMFMASRVIAGADDDVEARRYKSEYYKYKKIHDDTDYLLKGYKKKAEEDESYKDKRDKIEKTRDYTIYKIYENYDALLKEIKDEKKGESGEELAALTAKENELRKEMVELIYDIDNLSSEQVDSVITASLMQEVSEKGATRDAASKLIAKQYGVRDTRGQSTTEGGKLYKDYRTAKDMIEDDIMLAELNRAKKNGEAERADSISRWRNNIWKNSNNLTGVIEDDKVVMDTIRSLRKQAFEELRIGKPKRSE